MLTHTDGSSTFDQSGNSLTNISSTANIWPWSPLTQSQTAYQTAVISGVRCGPVVPPITLNLLLDPVGGRVTVYILLPSNSSVEYVQVQYFIIFAFPSNFFAISKETGVVGTGDLNFQFLSKLAGPTVGVSTMVVFKNKQVCVGASCPSLYTTPAACTALSGVQV